MGSFILAMPPPRLPVRKEGEATLLSPVLSCPVVDPNNRRACCREAAEKAGYHTEAALMGALPMHVPDFKTLVMPAIVAALDEWKQDAERSAWPSFCICLSYGLGQKNSTIISSLSLPLPLSLSLQLCRAKKWGSWGCHRLAS